MHPVYGIFKPRIVALVRDQVDVELDPRIEARRPGVPGAVDEVASIGNIQTVTPEQPLVDFHLPLVANVPILVDSGDGHLLGGRLVVDDEVLPIVVYPQVVDGARDDQVGRLVVILDAFEVLPPCVNLHMLRGAAVEAVVRLYRVLRAGGTMRVEFPL